MKINFIIIHCSLLFINYEYVFEYTIEATDGYARAWKFHTAHGSFETPIFMPVGTKASVKGISKDDLEEMGAQIILNNTYHLYLRPGDEVVKSFGGVHKFQSYNNPILTDSGGFQVFSLGQGMRNNSPLSLPFPQREKGVKIPSPLGGGQGRESSLVKITEDGVHFRSHVDGSKHYFTAENIMDIQSNLGADIIMAFDECAPGYSDEAYAKAAMERTHRWAERCVTRWKENETKRKNAGLYPQALFPIVQGVTYENLRRESAEFIGNLDTPGVAVGGLSVGESKEDMYRILDVMKETLPREKPHYLMGVGTPEDLVEGIARGMDMFDCVLPTRLGRHGVAFSTRGNIKIKNEQWKLSDEHLDSECDCKVCTTYSKGYLRHLIQENEILGMQLLSYHNLYFLIHICRQARTAILEQRFEDFRKDFRSKYKL